MTEHCVNFDMSQCQTEDATHLILTYNQFKANKTIGHTYSGERADLAFHLAADPEAPIYRLKLFVVNPTDRTWNVLLYENPHDYASASSITTLAAKSDLELYTLREYEFSNKEEVLVFFRFGDKLFDVEQVELHRLWECLNNLHEQQMFTDMIVSNGAGDHIPAHRAVIAAATHALHNSVASLEPIELADETSVASGSTGEDTDNDAVTESGDNDDLEEAFVAFANAVYKGDNPDEEKALIENLKETIEDTLNIIISNNNTSDVLIEQPNPNRFKMVINGLRPRKHLEEFLRYVYTGKFNMKPKLLDDDHVEFIRKLDDMLSVIYLFNMTKLVKKIEVMLQPLLKEHTAIDLLQLANQYDMGKLKAKVVHYLRSPKYVNILNGVEDTMSYKCVITNPIPKYQSQFHYYFAMQAGKNYLFYLNGFNILITISNCKLPSGGAEFKLLIKLKNNSTSHLVDVLISTLQLTVMSKKADVEEFVFQRNTFVVNKTKIISLMPATAFLNKGYCENNSIMVKFFIEANHLDWI